MVFVVFVEVINAVVFETIGLEQFCEDINIIPVFGLIFFAKTLHIDQILDELRRHIRAELFRFYLHLNLPDLCVLLESVGGFDTLPGGLPFDEEDHHISNGFHIVSTTQFVPLMTVATNVTNGSGHHLICGERDVLSLFVEVFLTETQIYYMNR